MRHGGERGGAVGGFATGQQGGHFVFQRLPVRQRHEADLRHFRAREVPLQHLHAQGDGPLDIGHHGAAGGVVDVVRARLLAVHVAPAVHQVHVAAHPLQEQRHPAVGELLHGGVVNGQALVHGCVHLRDQRAPLALDQRPALENAPELGRAEVLAVSGHEGQRFEPVAHVGGRARHHAVAHQGQAAAQFGGLLDLHVQRMDLLGQYVLRIKPVVAQQFADVGQRQPHVAQRLDGVQALHVGLAVQAVARVRALRRREQPDLVVVVQRAHREARAPRQLPDLQPHAALSGAPRPAPPRSAAWRWAESRCPRRAHRRRWPGGRSVWPCRPASCAARPRSSRG